MMSRSVHLGSTLLLASLLAGPGVSFAQGGEHPDPRWRLCPTPLILSPAQRQHLEQLPSGVLHGQAEQLFSEADGPLRLLGRVQLEQQGMQLFSQQADYDRQNDHLLLIDAVMLRSPSMQIKGESASYHPGQQHGTVTQASFFLANSHSFGSAEQLIIHDPQQLELSQLRYTTCPPEQPDWQLRARRLKLNQATNTGEAYHATVRFKGVPIFYSPYLNFPLAGRKSGLLPPTFGSSDSNGTDFSLPVYWNIAPHRDATFTPRHLAKRGNMLGAEYRFLGQQSAGEVYGSLLPNDRQTSEDRSELSLRHQARLSDGWHSELLYRGVSDHAFYHDDLGNPQDDRNASQLERRFDLRYSDPHWQFLARAQDYQTLDGISPYQRLPQLQLRGSSPRHNNRLHYSLHSEAVSFRHRERQPTGERVDLKPALTLPMAGMAWFLTPTLAWRHTEYQLQDHLADVHQVRSLPLTSLDSGLFFERPVALANRRFTQTLEPRLYFLHVPYREQDELPLFDSSRSYFSYAGLFRDNRFNGADRQGDARQITLGISSRLLEDGSGRERASVALAQAHYLEERRVTLEPAQPPETRQQSDIIAELGLSPLDHLSLRLTEQWNPDTRKVEQIGAGMRYTPGQGQAILANYRYYRPEALHQADLTMLWPLGPQWRILAHHNRDLHYRRTMESIAGLEYQSCCWTIRLIGKAQRNSVDDTLNHSIMLTLELKGLANLGSTLEQSIGYDIGL